jgi:hypothetical protein
MSGIGGRGRGRGRGRSCKGEMTNSNPSSDAKKIAPKVQKTLGDHIYYVGEARQASNFSVITDFIINHIRQTFKYGNDIANALDDRFHVDFNALMPERQELKNPDPTISKQEDNQFAILYQAEIKRFVERKGTYESNLDKVYAVIWDQCNKSMQNKLISTSDFDTNIKGKPIEIL